MLIHFRSNPQQALMLDQLRRARDTELETLSNRSERMAQLSLALIARADKSSYEINAVYHQQLFLDDCDRLMQELDERASEVAQFLATATAAQQGGSTT